MLVLQTTSCVPLLVGGAIGYIARDEGFGKVRPVDDAGVGRKYGYQNPPSYDDEAAYEYDDTGYTDEPVY